jgi:hypothetical protein
MKITTLNLQYPLIEALGIRQSTRRVVPQRLVHDLLDGLRELPWGSVRRFYGLRLPGCFFCFVPLAAPFRPVHVWHITRRAPFHRNHKSMFSQLEVGITPE